MDLQISDSRFGCPASELGKWVDDSISRPALTIRIYHHPLAHFDKSGQARDTESPRRKRKCGVYFDPASTRDQNKRHGFLERETARGRRRLGPIVLLHEVNEVQPRAINQFQ
jgi:hypothetical protein